MASVVLIFHANKKIAELKIVIIIVIIIFVVIVIIISLSDAVKHLTKWDCYYSTEYLSVI
jgi:uncharacterized membrane protein